MTRVATMGTSSCATIAIQGFKAEDLKMELDYQNGLITGHTPYKNDGGKGKNFGETVEGFYDKTIYPTRQDLGRTADYPFSLLMKNIDESSLNSKFIIATLNEYQNNERNGFWVELLEENGFSLVDKTKNSIGSMCYVYVRNKNRPAGFSTVVGGK